jgi:hypothetical protein
MDLGLEGKVALVIHGQVQRFPHALRPGLPLSKLMSTASAINR